MIILTRSDIPVYVIHHKFLMELILKVQQTFTLALATPSEKSPKKSV